MTNANICSKISSGVSSFARGNVDHCCARDLAGRQSLERDVDIGEREDFHVSADRDGGGKVDQVGDVSAGDVGDAADLALSPQQVVVELGNVIEVDRVDRHDPALVERRQGVDDNG